MQKKLKMSNASSIWTSWNKNIKHPFSNIHVVKTEKDIIDAVKNSKKIRLFGTKQSSSDIAAGTTDLIDIKEYNKILSYDELKRQITFQSGILLKDLIEKIESKVKFSKYCISHSIVRYLISFNDLILEVGHF